MIMLRLLKTRIGLICALGAVLSLAPQAMCDDVFSQTNLISDIPGLALTTDANLINPWGIAATATSPYWVSDQAEGVATLYNGLGTPSALVVTIPAGGPPSGPTGVVSVPVNVSGFDVPGTSTTSHFVFATLSGTITAWSSGNTAVTAAAVPGAVFTGLLLANNGTGNFLYAADFAIGGTIKVFDSNFSPISLPGSFTDPNLPAGYAPYNVQNVSGNLYVEYAKLGTKGAQVGAGFGYVDVFDTNGNFIKRLVSNGPLNAPWGVALAPAGFDGFGNDVLIGNFGDGEINAFDPLTGNFIGTIDDAQGDPLLNPGLWSLQFGNGNAGSTPNTLFFSAGINNEKDGLFGSIQADPEPSTLVLLTGGLLCLALVAHRKRLA
jgi:uncharacterized protein (TIGR03118 family)